MLPPLGWLVPGAHQGDGVFRDIGFLCLHASACLPRGREGPAHLYAPACMQGRGGMCEEECEVESAQILHVSHPPVAQASSAEAGSSVHTGVWNE